MLRAGKIRSRSRIREFSEDAREPFKRRGSPWCRVETSKLTQEAFAPGRHEILDLLLVEPLRYTDIVRRCELSDGEVSRHIQRLVAVGLVQKQATGTLAATPLARLVMRFSPSLSLIARHAEYFRAHDVHAMGDRFLLRIEDLGAAEFLKDPVEVFEGIKSAWGSVRTRFDGICLWADHIASGHAPPDGAFEFLRDRHPASRLIVHDEDLLPAREFHDRILRDVQYRIVPVSRVDMIIGDDAAFLSFATPEGRVDYNQAFFGRDPRFVGFCRDQFDAMWDIAVRTDVRVSLTDESAQGRVPKAKRRSR